MTTVPGPTPQKKTRASGAPPLAPEGAVDAGSLPLQSHEISNVPREMQETTMTEGKLSQETVDRLKEIDELREQNRLLRELIQQKDSLLREGQMSRDEEGSEVEIRDDPLLRAPDFVEQDGRITPKDLAKYEGPLFIKNLSPTLISHDDGRGNVMRVGPSYSPECFAALPIEIARWPGFQKMWRRGMFMVSTNPEMEDELVLAEALVSERERQQREALSAIVEEDSSTRDLYPEACIKCGAVTFQTKQAKLDGIPPLCNDDKGLVGMYTLEEYNERDKETGRLETKTRWITPVVTAPMKERVRRTLTTADI